MRRVIGAFVVCLALLVASSTSFGWVGVTYAHGTPDQAEDTPLVNANPNGEVGYGGALANGEAENSLLRNPTCGAHDGPDGIHPPGNP